MDEQRQGELVPAEVRSKLGALRRAISARLLLEGLAWTTAALVALVFVTLAFDYFFRLERDLRGILMALACAGVLVVLWRQLIRPLRVPMDAPELALLVERRFAQLGDRLISAVQFSRRTDTESLGISLAMVSRMAAEAAALAGPLRFREVVERRGIFRTWAVAGCALGLLLGFGVWQGDILSRWFKRNVLFAEVPWPQETYLAVRGGPDFPVLRGDDLQVVVDVEPRSRVVPEQITLHARYATIGHTEERLEPERDNPRKFVKVFPAVPEEFEFHVTGGDDRRDARRPHRVLLIDPPAFLKLLFTVKYPSYMRRSRPERFDGGTGAVGVPVGAEVTVEAEANKELASAKIVLDGLVVGEMRPQTVPRGSELATMPRQFVGAFEVVGQNKPVTKVLHFALTDTDGHTNRRGAKYMVQVQPDQRPTLDLRKLRIGSRISPRAVLPLQIRIKDDHGLAGAEVVVGRGAANRDANARPVELPPDPSRELDLAHELDIEPLKLAPGTTVYVMARATDTLPEAHGGPNVGESSALSFAVVKPEDLMEEFVNRQKEIRLEFLQAIALQESARTKTEAAVVIFAGGKVDPEARRLLMSSGGLQQNVGAEVAKAADSLESIVEEMRSNRIGTETEREQIRGAIVKPLKDLAGPIRDLTGSINATRSVGEAGELAAQAKAIQELQTDVLNQMNDICERMAKLESKQELANKLQIIIDWSESLLRSIRKKQEAEVGTIFESTTQPGRKNE